MERDREIERERARYRPQRASRLRVSNITFWGPSEGFFLID